MRLRRIREPAVRPRRNGDPRKQYGVAWAEELPESIVRPQISVPSMSRSDVITTISMILNLSRCHGMYVGIRSHYHDAYTFQQEKKHMG